MTEITYQTTCDGVDWAAMKATLVADDFDNGRTPEQLERSFRNSAVVALARAGGRIIGTARALSDGVCNAYVVDVWTETAYRRQGVARTMMALLIEQLPGQHLFLWTDDAVEFYTRIGFEVRPCVGLQRVVGEWLVNDLEDLDDLAVIAERKDEETIPHQQVIEELKKDGLSK